MPLHADLKDKTRAQLTRKMDAGEQLAGVKAASFTAAGAGTSEYVYCPGMDVDNARFTTNRKAFGLSYAGSRACASSTRTWRHFQRAAT